MKYIIQIDKKTGKKTDFLWPEKGEPPPLIKPQIKKRQSNHRSNNEEEEEKPS